MVYLRTSEPNVNRIGLRDYLLSAGPGTYACVRQILFSILLSNVFCSRWNTRNMVLRYHVLRMTDNLKDRMSEMVSVTDTTTRRPCLIKLNLRIWRLVSRKCKLNRLSSQPYVWKFCRLEESKEWKISLERETEFAINNIA